MVSNKDISWIYDQIQRRCENAKGLEKSILQGVLDLFGAAPEKWIPVAERLPKNDYGNHWKERTHYLVRLRNGLMRVAHYGYKEHDWWIDSHDCVLSKEHYTEVTHWRHLPEQPKEGDHEAEP